MLKRYPANASVAGAGCAGAGGKLSARWLVSSSVFSSYSGPPLTTLNPDLTLTGGTFTVAVAGTSSFTAPYTISFGSSGTVTCAAKTATSFTGCVGGLAGTYPTGTQVFQDGGVSPLTTLNVSLVADQTPGDASQRFTLSDAISLRNSRRH
jgi:hypothetical protein